MRQSSTIDATTEDATPMNVSTAPTAVKSDEMSYSEVVGLDLGDRYSHIFVMDRASGEELERGRVRTTEPALRRRFGGMKPMRVALETGSHSPWVSRVLKDLGHEVIVANPRKVGLIFENVRKNDSIDSEMLARLARMDPKLLSPIQHRGEDAQADLAVIRSRDVLVRNRTALVNHLRGVVKSFGDRLPSCSSRSISLDLLDEIPEPLHRSLSPVIEQIEQLTEQIKQYDRMIEQLADTRYPETKILRQIKGVGALTALAFVLTIENPYRFKRNRSIGAYFGLVPKTKDSGQHSPQLRISKAGNPFIRQLLVNCAHYILGPFGEDSDLRRHGERIAERGGQNAKKRAVIAVARKLSVLMLSLWKSGETYEPLRNSNVN